MDAELPLVVIIAVSILFGAKSATRSDFNPGAAKPQQAQPVSTKRPR